MNITFMIGNGFDLGCGMKTKYIDSYSEYCSRHPDGETETISSFKKRLERADKSWSDFETGMARSYLKIRSEEKFIECVRDYSIFLKNYLRKEEKDFWERFDKIDRSVQIAMFKHLSDSLFNFYGACMNNTVNQIEERIIKEKEANFDFINFNYTTVFEKILRKAINYFAIKDQIDFGPIEWNGKVNVNLEGINHIHGTLDKDMVMGVDNEAQFIGMVRFSEAFKRCFIKPAFNKAFDRMRVARAIDTIVKSDIICAVGLSFGPSDLSWTRQIKSWLMASKEHHLFYYDHALMSKTDTAAFELFELPLEAKKRLLLKMGMTDEMLLPQIHIPIGKWYFNICKQEALSIEGTGLLNPLAIY